MTPRQLREAVSLALQWAMGALAACNLILGNTQAATLNIAVLILLRQP